VNVECIEIMYAQRRIRFFRPTQRRYMMAWRMLRTIIVSALAFVVAVGVAHSDSASVVRGEAALAIERFATAEREFQAAIRAQDRPSGNPRILAQALRGLAWVHFQQQQLEIAASLARRAHDLAERQPDGFPAVRGGALNILGDVDRNYERLTDAIDTCDRAIVILEGVQPGARVELALALRCAASARMDRLEFRRSAELLHRARELVERLEPPNPSALVGILHGLSVLSRYRAQVTDDSSEQERFLVAAERVCRVRIGEPSLCAAEGLVHRALVLIERNQFDRAHNLIALSERMARNALGNADAFIASNLGLRAMIAMQHADYDASIQYAESELRYHLRFRGPNDSSVLHLRQIIAQNLSLLGRLQEAEAIQRDVVARARASYLPYNRALANHLNEYAIMLERLYRFTEADQIKREASNIEAAYLRHIREQFNVSQDDRRP
jgi:tetratricopeptide (TPR) repeat protein